MVCSRYPHRDPPLPDDALLPRLDAHSTDGRAMRLQRLLQLRGAGCVAGRMLHGQDLHVGWVDWALSRGYVDLSRRGDDHVLLDLGVHETEPAVGMGLDHDLHFALLSFPLLSGPRLAKADGDFAASALQQVAQLARGRSLLGSGEGDPAEPLARLPLFTLVSREVDALNLTAVLEGFLQAILLDVWRKPSQEDLVRDHLTLPVLFRLHLRLLLRLHLSLDATSRRRPGNEERHRCRVLRALPKRRLRHGGRRAQGEAVVGQAGLALAANLPQRDAATHVTARRCLEGRALVEDVIGPKDVVPRRQRGAKLRHRRRTERLPIQLRTFGVLRSLRLLELLLESRGPLRREQQIDGRLASLTGQPNEPLDRLRSIGRTHEGRPCLLRLCGLEDGRVVAPREVGHPEATYLADPKAA
mmetsp:Transcript_4781/g.10653  ORF Transcript_4781/g.10653 Transcript_4781/m.10653 type:complete len:414 (+) Transcript_4781:531-1772(+)